MADLDLSLIDKVELAQRGLGGIATIAEFLSQKFANDVEIGPAADGLHVLTDATRDRLEEVAEELHHTRHQPAPDDPDPLVELGERNRRVAEEFEAHDAAADPERDHQLEQELMATTRDLYFTPARTMAGAMAQIRRVLHEIERDFGARGDGGHAVALRSVLAVMEARA